MAEQIVAALEWKGSLHFAARTGSGYTVQLDSPARPGHQGPSPMELIVAGIAGCTAIDVVAILGKMREPLESLAVEIRADRAPTDPKYFTALTITYRVRGHGLAREKVDRAVELSHQTYCSAVASLRPDCRVTSTVELDDV